MAFDQCGLLWKFLAVCLRARTLVLVPDYSWTDKHLCSGGRRQGQPPIMTGSDDGQRRGLWVVRYRFGLYGRAEVLLNSLLTFRLR